LLHTETHMLSFIPSQFTLRHTFIRTIAQANYMVQQIPENVT